MNFKPTTARRFDVQLRFLLITGPNTAPAVVDFGPGLNVIYGGSNTGKSHILRLVDYMLGAKDPPDPIIEQAAYDLVHLGIELDDGTHKTLVRALKGGDVRILEGLNRSRPEQGEGVSVSARHDAKASLSKLLLEQLGAANARIQTNASGKTRDLSFRDLARYALVNETKIQDLQSPALSGQYTQKTAETSVFKYILTGVDDSALDLAKPDAVQPVRQAAQLELLDGQIRTLEQEITEADYDHEELQQLDLTLDQELAQFFRVQETTEASYRELTSQRRSLRREHESVIDRIAEIDTLLARFKLLAEHYQSDQQRLTAVIEAGTLFSLEEGQVCPTCGADPQHHRPGFACDGNIEEILAAAEAEIGELQSRAAELRATIQELAEERSDLAERAREILPELESLQAGILNEVPSVQTVRSQTNTVISRKLTVQKSLDLIRRRDSLIEQRTKLGVVEGYDSSTIVAEQNLDGAVLDSFSQFVEEELQSWKFPEAQRVFFDLPKMDISVAGKARRANGKGVRALLHGAFNIALMRFCFSGNRRRPHPGFTMLDSVFVTYKDPDGVEDIAIQNTALKDLAFESFSQLPSTFQLVVLDNVDVPEWLIGNPQCIHFTGRPNQGRAGLFPPLSRQ